MLRQLSCKITGNSLILFSFLHFGDPRGAILRQPTCRNNRKPEDFAICLHQDTPTDAILTHLSCNITENPGILPCFLHVGHTGGRHSNPPALRQNAIQRECLHIAVITKRRSVGIPHCRYDKTQSRENTATPPLRPNAVEREYRLTAVTTKRTLEGIRHTTVTTKRDSEGTPPHRRYDKAQSGGNHEKLD